MNKRYAISSKKNVLVPATADTTASRYPVLTFRALRSFVTRDEARNYKQGLPNPRNYSLIDRSKQMVIR